MKQTIWNCPRKKIFLYFSIYLFIYLFEWGGGSFLYGRLKRRLGFKPMWNKARLRNPEPLCETAFLPMGATEAPAEGVPAARPRPGETSSVNTMQRERVGRKGMEKRFCITLSCFVWIGSLSACVPADGPWIAWKLCPVHTCIEPKPGLFAMAGARALGNLQEGRSCS